MNSPSRPVLAMTVLALAVLCTTGCTDDPAPAPPAPTVTETPTAPEDALSLSRVHSTLDEPVANLTYATNDPDALALCADLFGTPEEIASWLGVDQVVPLVTGSGYALTWSPTADHRGCAWQERPFLPADPLLVTSPEYLSADTAETIEARYTQAGPGVVCFILSEQVAPTTDGTTNDGVVVDCQLGPGLVYAYPAPELASNQDAAAVLRLEPITQAGRAIHERLPELESLPFTNEVIIDDLTLDTVYVDESNAPPPETDTEDQPGADQGNHTTSP